MNNKVIGALVIIGIAIVGIGIYLILRPSPTESQVKSNTISIPFTSYTGHQWDVRGATIEMKNSAGVNVWMANTGFIRYSVDLPEAKNGTVSVLMSSELLPEEELSTDILTSDVTLVVNGKESGTQNVTKDTGMNNQRYIWNASFQKGQNSIEFQVKKDARNRHGITIWSPIEIK